MKLNSLARRSTTGQGSAQHLVPVAGVQPAAPYHPVVLGKGKWKVLSGPHHLEQLQTRGVDDKSIMIAIKYPEPGRNAPKNSPIAMLHMSYPLNDGKKALLDVFLDRLKEKVEPSELRHFVLSPGNLEPPHQKPASRSNEEWMETDYVILQLEDFLESRFTLGRRSGMFTTEIRAPGTKLT